VANVDARALLLDERRARVDAVVARRTRSLVVVLEDLEDPHNIAAVLRTCEAVARNFAFHPNPKITQGAEKWLDLAFHRDTAGCLRALKARGFTVCATWLGEEALSLLDLSPVRPLALVFGTEKTGVTRAVLEHCDLRFCIPMRGFTQSLNISVAAAVCLSHLVFERSRRGVEGDLGPDDAAVLRDRFYALSVKQRHRLFDRGGGTVNPPRDGASKGR
jgi:tRNA (guanosine-2'-O-)-methyltransferase